MMEDVDSSAAPLALRWPLWEALADFWLDTELLDFQLDHVARVIAESSLTLREARRLHDLEVAPVVSMNLASVAGEWAGFDPHWLQDRCSRQVARLRYPWYRWWLAWQRPLFYLMTRRYWRAIEQRFAEIETLRSRID